MYKENFGKDQEGSQAELITLTNAKGTEVKISTLGATVVSFIWIKAELCGMLCWGMTTRILTL